MLGNRTCPRNNASEAGDGVTRKEEDGVSWAHAIVGREMKLQEEKTEGFS